MRQVGWIVVAPALAGWQAQLAPAVTEPPGSMVSPGPGTSAAGQPSPVPSTSIDCAIFPQPVAPRLTIAPQDMTIGIGNGTTLSIAPEVNGTLVATYAAGQGDLIDASRLPALPWDVRAHTSSGRVLLSMAVHEGDLWREPCASDTLDVRVDLSCGRLEL